MKTIIVKGLPDNMIRNILPDEITDTEIAYANINTILFFPIEDGGSFVVFDAKSEWSYLTDLGAEELFRRMSGSTGATIIEKELN